MTGADVASRLRDAVRDSKILRDGFSRLVHGAAGRDFPRYTAGEQEDWKIAGIHTSSDEIERWFHQYMEKEAPFLGIYRINTESESIILRFKRNLPSFDGFWHSDNLLSWVDDIEDFFEEVKPPQQLKCKIVWYKMKGAAYYWWKQLQEDRKKHGKEEIISWPRMKKLLLNRFLPSTCSTKGLILSYNSNKDQSGTENDENNKSSSAGEGSVEEQPKDVLEVKPATCSLIVPLEADPNNHDEESELSSLGVFDQTDKDVGIETLENTTSHLLLPIHGPAPTMALSEITCVGFSKALKFSDHIRNEFDEVTREEQKLEDEVIATEFIVRMQPNFAMPIAGLFEMWKEPHGPVFLKCGHQYRLFTFSMLCKCTGSNYSEFVSLLFDPGGDLIFGKSKCIVGYDCEIFEPKLKDKMALKVGATLLSRMPKRFGNVLDNLSCRVPHVVEKNDLDRARKQTLLVLKIECMQREQIGIAFELKLIIGEILSLVCDPGGNRKIEPLRCDSHQRLVVESTEELSSWSLFGGSISRHAKSCVGGSIFNDREPSMLQVLVKLPDQLVVLEFDGTVASLTDYNGTVKERRHVPIDAPFLLHKTTRLLTVSKAQNLEFCAEAWNNRRSHYMACLIDLSVVMEVFVDGNITISSLSFGKLITFNSIAHIVSFSFDPGGVSAKMVNFGNHPSLVLLGIVLYLSMHDVLSIKSNGAQSYGMMLKDRVCKRLGLCFFTHISNCLQDVSMTYDALHMNFDPGGKDLIPSKYVCEMRYSAFIVFNLQYMDSEASLLTCDPGRWCQTEPKACERHGQKIDVALSWDYVLKMKLTTYVYAFESYWKHGSLSSTNNRSSKNYLLCCLGKVAGLKISTLISSLQVNSVITSEEVCYCSVFEFEAYLFDPGGISYALDHFASSVRLVPKFCVTFSLDSRSVPDVITLDISMMMPIIKVQLDKQGYKILGSHRSIKLCRLQLGGFDGYYKEHQVNCVSLAYDYVDFGSLKDALNSNGFSKNSEAPIDKILHYTSCTFWTITPYGSLQFEDDTTPSASSPSSQLICNIMCVDHSKCIVSLVHWSYSIYHVSYETTFGTLLGDEIHLNAEGTKEGFVLVYITFDPGGCWSIRALKGPPLFPAVGVMSWEEKNFIMSKLNVFTVASCLKILCEENRFTKMLELFHKMVDGLGPPIDRDDVILLVRSGRAFCEEGWR